MNNPFGLGAHESTVDPRNHTDDSLALGLPYPATFKVDWGIVPIRMQFKIGKCVAEAVTRYVEKLYYRKTGTYVALSDDFLYMITKKYFDGNTDEGTSFLNVLKAAQKYGICRFDTFNLNVNADTIYSDYISNINNISETAIDEAANYRIGQYLSIPLDMSIIQSAIYKYDGIVGRFLVGNEWWTDDQGNVTWDGTKLNLTNPKVPESGHGVDLDGYNSLIVAPKIQGDIANSWSKDWGLFGYEPFVFDDYMPTEVWAITLNPVPTTPDTSAVISSSVVLKLIAILKKFSNTWLNKAN